jgi:integrase
MWLTALRAAGRSPKTLFIYDYAVGQLDDWRGDADLTTVSRFEALRFVQALTDQFKPSGVASRVKALRAFYNWCVAEELAATNPFARVTVTVPADPRPTANAGQIEAMLANAKRGRSRRRDVALLTLLVDSGARKGEVAAMTIADVDLASGFVTFPTSKSRPRTVKLSDRGLAALAYWMRERGVGPGSLWRVADPYSLVKALVARHSHGELTPHALRRHFAVQWLAKGGSETGLMRVCGWSSREMIGVYTQASADALAADEYSRLMASLTN